MGRRKDAISAGYFCNEPEIKIGAHLREDVRQLSEYRITKGCVGTKSFEAYINKFNSIRVAFNKNPEDLPLAVRSHASEVLKGIDKRLQEITPNRDAFERKLSFENGMNGLCAYENNYHDPFYFGLGQAFSESIKDLRLKSKKAFSFSEKRFENSIGDFSLSLRCLVGLYKENYMHISRQHRETICDEIAIYQAGILI